MLDRRELVALRRQLRRGPATTTQIARACGWAIAGAEQRLQKLRETGHLELDDASAESPRWLDAGLAEYDRIEARADPPTNPYAPSRVEQRVEDDRGNFSLGLLAGLFGGVLIVAMFAIVGKPATKRGVHWGFGIQVAVIIVALLVR